MFGNWCVFSALYRLWESDAPAPSPNANLNPRGLTLGKPYRRRWRWPSIAERKFRCSKGWRRFAHSVYSIRKTVEPMATNKPTGDNRRKGAVRKRSQLKGKVMGKSAWTKRSKETGRFMDVKKSKKKFKGVRREKKAA